MHPVHGRILRIRHWNELDSAHPERRCRNRRRAAETAKGGGNALHRLLGRYHKLEMLFFVSGRIKRNRVSFILQSFWQSLLDSLAERRKPGQRNFGAAIQDRAHRRREFRLRILKERYIIEPYGHLAAEDKLDVRGL